MINSKLPTILVTGGAGYIGSFTVKQLLAADFDVAVVDSLENGHRAALRAAAGSQGSGVRGQISSDVTIASALVDSQLPTPNSKLRLEVADVGDKEAMRGIFDKYKIEAVIDFAAYLSVGESMENPKKYLVNNVVNFVNLLDVMREKKCKYIIKSSTASVYGDPEDKYFPLTEDYQGKVRFDQSGLLPGNWDGKSVKSEEFLKQFLSYYDQIFKDRVDLRLDDEEMAQLRIPTSIYGLTKLLDEIILGKYEKNYDIKFVALRYFNVCGGSLDGDMGDDKPVPTNLMTLVILNIIGKTGKLQIFGNDYPTRDGTGLRDYIHPTDLATGHVKALKYLLEKDESGVFNLGTGEGYTVFEVIGEVEKSSGKKVDYEVVDRRSGDPTASYANPKKANDLLGWKTEYGLKEMAETAWRWHEKHPDGYESQF